MWDFNRFYKNIALTDDNNMNVSYKEIYEFGEKLCSIIGRRCLVFVLCENSISSILGYTAFVNGGIVPILVNAHMEAGLLNKLIISYKPSYIWMPSEINIEQKKYKRIFSYIDYSLVETGFGDSYAIHDDLCMLLTTSGSTGSPKFVRQSYLNVRINAESIVEYLDLDSSERPITTLPMNYTYGLSIINSHLLVGATILVTSKGITQKEFWRFFRNEEATSFGGVPYTYEMLDKLRFYKMELPSLRYMTQAGGKLPVELHEKLAQYAATENKRFFVMYGQCEATARMGYLPAEKALEKRGSMGIAIPGGKFKLIDNDGKEILDENVTGELVYEGANVTMGYADSYLDLEKGDERRGILCTGDMAQFDKDGYFYIVGRKKRFLKIYGNRINLDEIESMIKENLGNIDVASAGIDDHMYIFLTDGRLAHDVKELLVDKTKLNHIAFQTVIVDEIPKNDSGKTLYKELMRKYIE